MLASGAFVLMLGPSAPEPSLPIPPADYQLQWQAPEDCPDAASIEAKVATLLGDRNSGEGVLEVSGTVSAIDHHYMLTLSTSLRGRTAIREVSSPRCAELAETVALVVAVSMEHALEPEFPGPTLEPSDDEQPRVPEADEPIPDRTDEPRPAGTPEPEFVSVPAPLPSPQSPPRSQRRPRPHPVLRLGLGAEYGALPGVSAALRAGVGASWSRARIQLDATYLAPRRAEGPGGSAGLYQQGMVTALGCGLWSAGRWAVPLCAGVEAGGLRVDGRGLQTSRSHVGPWLGPVARAGVLARLRRVSLWADLEGVARGIATRVIVDESPAFEPSVVSLRLLAGIELSWP